MWILYHDGAAYLKTDGRGLVTAFGAFMEAHPVGHYTVYTNGVFDMTLYEPHSGVIPFSGYRRDLSTWQFVFGSSTSVIRRVANPGALAGVWRGTIGPYTNVYLGVRSDGFIPVVSNLAADLSVGSVYADGSNTVAGFFWTGADVTSAWNRVHITGVLTGGTNIFGDYELDWDLGWITAGVNLKKP